MFLFSITDNEDISDSIHRILSEQYQFIVDTCNKYDDPHTAIHDIRKSFKRIRAVLKLIKPDIPIEVYRRENTLVRDLSRKFSKARNLHVFAEEFENIMAAGILKLPEETTEKVRSHFKEKEKEAVNLLVDLEIFRIVAIKTEEAKNRIAEIDFSSLGPHTIYKGVGDVFSWGQKQMTHTQQIPTDKNLHEMRKRIKALMYLVQLIKDVSPDFFTGFYEGLKSASLALGDDHNMAEMLSYIETMDNEIIPWDDKQKLQQYIKSQRQQIQVDVWPLIAKLYTGQADEFARRIKSYWLLGRQG